MKPDPTLEELAEFIADGVAIDWNAERERCAEGQRGTLERLELLDRMRRALEAPDDTDEPFGRMDRWGHLRILDRLGVGASSIVFRAHDATLNRDVALKLRTGRSSRPEDLAAWIEEARRLARVRHPNVVAVHGADVHHGVPGLWCDLVRGATLAERSKEAPPSHDEALVGAEALLSAVLAVHRAGLVHGDIKPDNVMVDAEGHLVLMDFGAAGRFDGVEDAVDRAGTPLAMAPERFSRASLTPAVDVFGAGVALFHWFEGRYPVVGSSAASIRARWARGNRPVFRRRTAPAALRRLLLQMMATDPAERPCATEALNRIQRMRTAPLRRLRIGAAVAVIAGLSLALTIALSALQSADRAQRETAVVNAFLSDVLEAPRRTRLGPKPPLQDLLEDSALRAEAMLIDQPGALARVLGTIGTSFVKLQQYDRAGPLLERAEQLHVDYGRSVEAGDIRLARAELAMDEARFGDARELHRRVLREVDDDGPAAAALRVRARIGLAHVDLAEGHLDQAREAVAAAFDQLAREPELREPETLRAATRLAAGELELRTGHYEAARQELEQALDFYDEAVGTRHLNASIARTGLIEAYDRLGRLDEALVLAETHVANNLEWLGPADRLSVVAQDALANLLLRRGRPERALTVNAAALDALEGAQSGEPWLVLQLESNRAAYLLDAGRSEEALRLIERVLPRLVDTLGAGHTVTWTTALNKADALLAEGRAVEALALARDLDRRSRAQFGEQHLFTLVASYLVGGSLNATGEFEAAEPVLLESHGELQRQLGSAHPLTLKAASLLTLNWQQRGRTEEAHSLAESAARTAREALGAEHHLTRQLAALLESPKQDE